MPGKPAGVTFALVRGQSPITAAGQDNHAGPVCLTVRRKERRQGGDVFLFGSKGPRCSVGPEGNGFCKEGVHGGKEC